MCFEYMFSAEVDEAYKKEVEDFEKAEDEGDLFKEIGGLPEGFDGEDFLEYKESQDDDGFPDVLPM